MSQLSRSPLPKFLLGRGTEFYFTETTVKTIDSKKTIGRVDVKEPETKDSKKTLILRGY